MQHSRCAWTPNVRPRITAGTNRSMSACGRCWPATPPPPPYNAPDIQAQFAAGRVPFGVHLHNRLLRRLQDDLGQRGRPTMGPAADWPGYAVPGAHLLLMPQPPDLMPLLFPPFAAHHHHHMDHHHFPRQHVHQTALLSSASIITNTIHASMWHNHIPCKNHSMCSLRPHNIRCRSPRQSRWGLQHRVHSVRQQHPRFRQPLPWGWECNSRRTCTERRGAYPKTQPGGWLLLGRRGHRQLGQA